MYMHHQEHRFAYDAARRRKLQNPEQILQSIGMREGMCLVDIGCNDGFFTLPAARIAGKKGKVIAIDIDGEALCRLQNKLLAGKIINTEVIHRPAEDVVACRHCADIIFFGTVLHDFQDPLKVLRNSKMMLKPDGIIYDYDWIKQDSPMGPPPESRFSQEYVEQIAGRAGLKVAASTLIDDHFYAMTIVN